MPAPNGIATACELATGAGCNAALGETCQPTASGLCVDPSSSQNDGTPSSERFTEGNEMEFAIEDPDQPGHSESLATLRTNKFINTTARTVHGLASLPGANGHKPGNALLVWGRPHSWVSRAARRRSTCLRIRCRSREHGTGAGSSAPGSTPASTRGTDRRAGRGSRPERSRSRSMAWSAAARSRSCPW